MKNHIYIFSGLGADERVFKKLDFSNYSTTHIKWVVPHKDERIEEYATRLLQQMPASNPILVGISFGGMMAVEVAKLIQTDRVVLISSAKTKFEIPLYYRWIGMLRVHRCIPVSILKTHNILTNWFFGATTQGDKELLESILTDTDPTFLRWAIDKILSWKNETVPAKVAHVHGTKDKYYQCVM